MVAPSSSQVWKKPKVWKSEIFALTSPFSGLPEEDWGREEGKERPWPLGQF